MNQRRVDDFYETPGWVTRVLLSECLLPGGRWLEPSIGRGAIPNAVARADVVWSGVDINLHRGMIPGNWFDSCERLQEISFLTVEPTPYEVVFGNPPFSLAMEFVEHSLKFAPTVVMLLRLAFLESAKRNGFLRKNPPDVFVSPKRPSFTGNGTDSAAYAWMKWGPGRPPGVDGRQYGELRVLPLRS